MNRYLLAIGNLKGAIRNTLYLLGDQRRKVPGLLLLFLVGSLLDLLGIGLVAPYVGMVIDGEGSSPANVPGLPNYIDLQFSTSKLLYIFGAALFALFGIKSIVALGINRTIFRFSMRHCVRLRSRLMSTYFRLPYIDYVNRNSAGCIQATQFYTFQFTVSLQIILRMISEGIVVVAILALLATVHGEALVLLVVLLVFIVLGYDMVFRKRSINYGKQVNARNIDVIRSINESFAGLKEIRVLGRETYFLNMIEKYSSAYVENYWRAQVVNIVPRYLLELAIITFCVLLISASLFFKVDLQSLIPMVAVFGVASLRLLPAANVFAGGLAKLRFNQHGIDMLCRDLRADVISVDYQDRIEQETQIEPFRKVDLQDVKFRYSPATNWILDELNLTIRAGESIGLTGESGCGKSTLVDVILRLLEPEGGTVSANGQDLKELTPKAWQKRIAYLPQEVFLIDNTLRRNIALGIDDEDVNESELIECMKKAQLSDFINQLPNGLNTLIGERGTRLSGGQRQRVALARAFYHKRDILIMDEATSALDRDTEKEIVREIKHLKGDKTVIVIAHRLSTVQFCDRVYVMKNGKLWPKKTEQASSLL